jgi:ketosteroid isomerase-like protein
MGKFCMPMIAIRSALVAALLTFSPPLSAHEPTAKTSHLSALAPTARDAAATVDAFHAALQRGDTNAAAALLADDVLIFEGGGVERSKAEYASHHLAADAEFAQAVPSTVTNRSGGAIGDIAWIASEGGITGTYKGKPIDRVTAETMVLRRIGTAWKIVHIHWSSAAKP